MLTTFAGDWLIYFTNDAKPPDKGLFMPQPKSPSITTSFSVSLGGSKFVITSVKSFARLCSNKRCLFCSQSGERLLWILNKYTLTLYPSPSKRRATASASPPLLPGPANTTKGVCVFQRSQITSFMALAARSIRSKELMGSCSIVYLSSSFV